MVKSNNNLTAHMVATPRRSRLAHPQPLDKIATYILISQEMYISCMPV